MFSLQIAHGLAAKVTAELHRHELELIFSAVESGPVAIARLNSSSFAQEALNRLAKNSDLPARAVTEISITGGEQGKYTYARWVSGQNGGGGCKAETNRSFDYPDAIHPFEVSISWDSCRTLPEQTGIYKSSNAAGAFVLIIASVSILLVFWPVGSSIKESVRILAHNDRASLASISFSPIRDLTSQALRNVKLEKEAALSNLASQVAHDIRSPVAALRAAVSSADSSPSNDTQFMISEATRRISEIANRLLTQVRTVEFFQSSSHQVASVEAVVDAIISEKRMEYQNKANLEITSHFESNRKGLYVRADPNEVKSILSNLLNNSIESLRDDGKISLRTQESNGFVELSIIDNGCGIPINILQKIGEKGLTFGKPMGTGLGIFHATECMSRWGGKLEINSKPGTGTTVTLKFVQIKPQTPNGMESGRI